MNIRLVAQTENQTYKVFDMNGRVLLQGSVGKNTSLFQLKTADLPAGM
ncbi:MAG: T9SS type A sorting domain-containing protein, partial [Bacteroidetes bacterium]|nr:T9SS type A sorting domain-containing protein [Bacteroidota bacterium]MBU1580560.1 T9SS type A sorting domain-containing protein [Bacteroidota bacterium]